MARQITSKAVDRWRLETEFLPKKARRHTFSASDGITGEHGDGHDAYTGCSKAKADSRGTWRKTGSLGYLGKFGVAEKERCEDDTAKGKFRVVKVIKKRDWPTDADAKQELEALDVFSDPLNLEYKVSFVQYFGWFANLPSIFLAMEYMPLGNLAKHFGKSGCSEKEAATVTYQLLRALKFMHDRGFVHRNLKPTNIMVTRPAPDWRVKLADFGICRPLKLRAYRRDMDGTASYVAPECDCVAYHLGDRPYLPGNQPDYSPAIDVWALGGMAYLVRAGEPPFESIGAVNAYLEDPAANFPTGPLRGASKECVDFIRKAMAGNEDARPTVAALLGDSWLASFAGLDGSVRDG